MVEYPAMSTPLFIWLGSGRARRRGVGPAARLLDQAANAGLPVPAGAVLLDEFFRAALQSDLARQTDERVTIPDPELWHNTIYYSLRLPRFRRRVALVPVIADGAPRAQAATCQELDFNDATAAARAFEEAWSTIPAMTRHDVLVIEAIAAERTGTATTTTEATTDRVTLTDTGALLMLPQLQGRGGPDSLQPPFARRLQQLLRGTRRTLGPGSWQVAWADDGRICWLTLIAAVTDGRSTLDSARVHI